MKFSYLSVITFASAVIGQLHPNTGRNKCLEVRGDVRANGTPVQIFDCNGTPGQQWNLNPGATAVQLVGSNFCLDAGNDPTNGTLMKIWTCFPGIPAQSWFFTADARIALLNQGLCLDMPDGNSTNGNPVQVWKCTDGDIHQIWTYF